MEVATKAKVTRFIKEHRSEFAEKFGVLKIGLFGSIVRGGLTKNSDIDIVIEMRPDKKDLHNFLSFKRYLEAHLGMQVDLGIESTLKKAIRKEVEKQIVYV